MQTSLKDRLKLIAIQYGYSIRRFEEQCQLGRGNVSNMAEGGTIGSDKLTKIIDNFPDVSVRWLLTGEGDILQPAEAKPMTAIPAQDGIPLVSATAVGGFGNVEFSIQTNDVKGVYVVPKFQDKKIDFMIEVSGSSMYPKYNSGDVVACRIIHESQFIQWNKVHVVATREQGLLVKRLKPSKHKNCILAVSDNKNYDPFEIPLAEIEGLALVVGVIRLE